jgi:hypothetical protein
MRRTRGRHAYFKRRPGRATQGGCTAPGLFFSLLLPSDYSSFSLFFLFFLCTLNIPRTRAHAARQSRRIIRHFLGYSECKSNARACILRFVRGCPNAFFFYRAALFLVLQKYKS